MHVLIAPDTDSPMLSTNALSTAEKRRLLNSLPTRESLDNAVYNSDF